MKSILMLIVALFIVDTGMFVYRSTVGYAESSREMTVRESALASTSSRSSINATR